ncbi:MAG TPA: glycosyltransferase [Polyangia bacterium]|nr:glycosyltransferase [Polyangia bacterium]
MRKLLGITAAVAALAVGYAYFVDPRFIWLGSTATDLALLGALAKLTALPGLLALAGIAVLVASWRWHHELALAVAPLDHDGAVQLVRYPSVTIVRPVRGRDVGAEDNFRAALDTGYPGEVETLFVFDDHDDPGLPVARAVVAEHRARGRGGRADVIVAGAPPPGRTGKLNAMIVGAERASGSLIGFGDSDTRPDRNVLRGVVEALETTPGAGAAFAPVLVDQAPTAAGDALYAIMQNAMYSPLAAQAAGPKRTLPFIMGQLMVFERHALDAIGGVRAAQGQLVDDMAIGRALHEAGYLNVMSRAPLHIATGGMTLRELIPVYRRWMLFSKNGLPLSFTWRQWLTGVSFYGALAIAMAALATGSWAAALPALAAVGFVGASQLVLQRRYGGAAIPLRMAWVAWGVFLLAPAILVSNWLRHDVAWRGRVYAVDAKAALATVVAHEPLAAGRRVA